MTIAILISIIIGLSAILLIITRDDSKKVYISGKISGLWYNQAYVLFEQATDEIEMCIECEAVNPIVKGLPNKYPWLLHMMWDILLLMRCNHIYMLTNWKDSRGARIEHKVAKALGFTVIYQQPKFIDRVKHLEMYS